MEDSVGSVSPPKNLKTEILFVTPGETYFDVFGKLMGLWNVELNAKGKAQAYAVSQLIGAGDRISAVYSSDLSRVLDTAQNIAAVCGLIEVRREINLRDRSYGPLQALRSWEFYSASPNAYQALVSADEDMQGGVEPHLQDGVERLSYFSERCVTCLERIASNHRGQKIVVVTDIAVIKALYKRSSLNSDCPVWLSPTTMSEFSFSNELTWTLDRYYDDCHVSQFPANPENARYYEYFLVRCGECDYKDGQEHNLTRLGELHASLLADYLKASNICSIYTATNWPGALKTAHCISFKCLGSRVYTDANLNSRVLVLPRYNEVGIEIEPGFEENAEVFISRCRNTLLQIAGPLYGNQFVVAGKAVVVCDEMVIGAISSLCGNIPPGIIARPSVTRIILSAQNEWVMCQYNSTINQSH